MPDSEVLWFDVTQVKSVREIIIKMLHHVQKAECNVNDGSHPASVSSEGGADHIFQGKKSFVPGMSSCEILHSIKVSTRANNS